MTAAWDDVLSGDGRWSVLEGDCVEAMAAMPENSVDAIVTDPPYGLEFMGKEWDRLDGGFSPPGIGARRTAWPNVAGDPFGGYNPTCANCGGRLRGKRRCECEVPDWRIKGRSLEASAVPKPGNLGGFADGNKPSFERVRSHLPAMQAWHHRWAVEALRVLKPGGHLVAFGGTRTYHRLACALEDAGFEIRDTLCWLQGQGFPKNLDVSKGLGDAICHCEPSPQHHLRSVRQGDLSAGARMGEDDGSQGWILDGAPLVDGAENRTLVASVRGSASPGPRSNEQCPREPGTVAVEPDGARPVCSRCGKPMVPTGLGTALKPSHEPIVLARKPLSEPTVVANVLKWGTGALNIGRCRIETGDDLSGGAYARRGTARKQMWGEEAGSSWRRDRGLRFERPSGRWPANVLLDEEAAAMLDAQSGDRPTRRVGKPSDCATDGVTSFDSMRGNRPAHGYTDSGGASRFFYVAKASRREREAGLDGIEIVTVEYQTWGDEARKARLQVDTGQSPPRVIAVSGTPDNDATEWSMFLFGNVTMVPSLLGIPSITIMETNSIIESRTLCWLARLLTSAHIVVPNGEQESGRSRAANAGRSIPCLTITSERTASLPGADPVASATLWRISGSVASPASHPTVKPIQLMRYLCRLVAPPDGVVLDPFVGSGTTGIAALQERFRFIGIDKESAYVTIARRRIAASMRL